MSDRTPVHGVPIPRQGDTSGERLAYLAGTIEEYKKSTPTYREVREEINGFATRLSTEIKAVPAEVDRRIATLATKEKIVELERRIDENSPPSKWKLVTGIVGAAVGTISTVALLIWSVGSRVSDMAVESALRKMQLDAAVADVKRLESEMQDVQRKLDQLLLRGAKP